ETVTGTGFAAGEAVAFALQPAHAALGVMNADSGGRVRLTFVVPPAAVGAQSLVLDGQSSDRTASVAVNVESGSGRGSPASAVAVFIIIAVLGALLLGGGTLAVRRG